MLNVYGTVWSGLLVIAESMFSAENYLSPVRELFFPSSGENSSILAACREYMTQTNLSKWIGIYGNKHHS